VETHYITEAPCADLFDAESFDKIAQNVPEGARRKKYINARKSVLIDIDKYYLWLYRAVWDCSLQITASAKQVQYYYGTQGNLLKNYLTIKIQSVVKAGVVQHGRDRKIPTINRNGRTTLVDDPSNPLPKGYPKDILYNIRSNPCFQTNGVTAYFDILVGYENAIYAITDQEPQKPDLPYAENVTYSRRKFNESDSSDKTYIYFVSFSTWEHPFCQIYISPNNGTYYDYSSKKYFTNINFGNSGIANWVGLQRLNEDAGENVTVRSKLSVDGINIPSGTTFIFGSYSFDSYLDSIQLSVSVDWTTSKRRNP
jgi:hypothetical protein